MLWMERETWPGMCVELICAVYRQYFTYVLSDAGHTDKYSDTVGLHPKIRATA